MKATVSISEDTFTKYLTDVQSHVKTNGPHIVEEVGKDIASLIYNRAEPTPKKNNKTPWWTGTLASSGLDRDEWIISETPKGIELDIVYSGLGNYKSWWEFNDDYNQGAPPDRDYAFFQETGIDTIADKEDARHKWFIRNTMHNRGTVKLIEHGTAREFMKLMQLK